MSIPQKQPQQPTLQPKQTPEPLTEDNFRSALEDVAAVVKILTPYCKTFDEMIAMVEHAIANPAQLRLLKGIVEA